MQGVGINDADYAVTTHETVSYVNGKPKHKQIWVCPFYRLWKSMLERSYSEKVKANNPTYKDCIVCDEWLTFSSFRDWVEQQDWEGKHLDKDLLVPGNKVYSPETCVFVSRQVNTFLTDCGAARGEYKIGVCWDKSSRKFQSRCNNPFTGKQEHLGLFTCEQEAHEAWLAKKLEFAIALAAIQSDERVAKALIDRYENYRAS